MTTLRALLIPETCNRPDGTTEILYSIVGLEHFIGAQGKTKEDAERAFDFVMLSTIAACRRHNMPPFEGIKPAPQAYFDAWETAKEDDPAKPVGTDMMVEQRCIAA